MNLAPSHTDGEIFSGGEGGGVWIFPEMTQCIIVHMKIITILLTYNVGEVIEVSAPSIGSVLTVSLKDCKN